MRDLNRTTPGCFFGGGGSVLKVKKQNSPDGLCPIWSGNAFGSPPGWTDETENPRLKSGVSGEGKEQSVSQLIERNVVRQNMNVSDKESTYNQSVSWI